MSEAEVEFWYIYHALIDKPLEEWVLLNIVNGERQVVGSIQQLTLGMKDTVTFPGGLLYPPDNSPINAIISVRVKIPQTPQTNNWQPTLH